MYNSLLDISNEFSQPKSDMQHQSAEKHFRK